MQIFCERKTIRLILSLECEKIEIIWITIYKNQWYSSFEQFLELDNFLVYFQLPVNDH